MNLTGTDNRLDLIAAHRAVQSDLEGMCQWSCVPSCTVNAVFSFTDLFGDFFFHALITIIKLQCRTL